MGSVSWDQYQSLSFLKYHVLQRPIWFLRQETEHLKSDTWKSRTTESQHRKSCFHEKHQGIFTQKNITHIHVSYAFSILWKINKYWNFCQINNRHAWEKVCMTSMYVWQVCMTNIIEGVQDSFNTLNSRVCKCWDNTPPYVWMIPPHTSGWFPPTRRDDSHTYVALECKHG